MRKDRNDRVVDSYGHVYKGDGATLTEIYPEFYVVDGGIASSSLGVNSSLTISALAFRIAENVASLSNLSGETSCDRYKSNIVSKMIPLGRDYPICYMVKV